MLLKSSFFSFFLTATGVVLSLMTTLFLVNFFGIEVLGTFSVFISYIFITSIIIKLGVPSLILKESRKGILLYNQLSTYTQILIGFKFLLLSTILTIYNFFIEIDNFVYIIFTIFFVVYHDQMSALLRGFFSPNLAQFLEIVFRPAIMLTLIILIFFLDLSVEYLFAVPLLSYLSSLTLLFFFLKRSAFNEKALSISLVGFKKFVLKYFLANLSLGFAGVASQSYQNIFLIVVESISGSTSAGIARLGLQLGALVNLSSASVNSLYSSEMSRLYHHGNFEKLRSLQLIAHRFMAVVSLITFSFVVIFFNFFSNYIQVEENSSFFIIILSVGYLFQGLIGPCGNILNMTGRQKINVILFVIADIALIIALFGHQYFAINFETVSILFVLLLFMISVLQRYFLHKLFADNMSCR